MLCHDLVGWVVARGDWDVRVIVGLVGFAGLVGNGGCVVVVVRSWWRCCC